MINRMLGLIADLAPGVTLILGGVALMVGGMTGMFWY